jgi:hypothetical protein
MRTFIAATLAAYCTALGGADFMEHIAMYNKSYDNAEEFLMR